MNRGGLKLPEQVDMRVGLLGKKLGMTHIFTEDGKFVPVTVIEAGPCTVLKIGQGSLTVGYIDKKEKQVVRPEAGFYKKINVRPKKFVRELPFELEDGKNLSIGQEITVDIFKEKDYVDVTGTSKGKGFQGGVRRWHWRGGPDSHGSMHHRRVGSIGASSFPSRVLKGQCLPGRMGNRRKTVQNLEVVKIYKDKDLMLVRGPVPGAINCLLEIKTAKKKRPVPRPEVEAKKGEKKN